MNFSCSLPSNATKLVSTVWLELAWKSFRRMWLSARELTFFSSSSAATLQWASVVDVTEQFLGLQSACRFMGQGWGAPWLLGSNALAIFHMVAHAWTPLSDVWLFWVASTPLSAGLSLTNRPFFTYLMENIFFFRDRVFLCSPCCPGTHSLDQAGLELNEIREIQDPPASAS